MKRSSFIKAVALCGVAALAFGTAAQAQVTKDEAKCRSQLNKGTTKYASTANKAVVGCIKDGIKGKNGNTSCTDPTAADAKGKLPGAASKLSAAAGKCAVFPPSYVTCPSPGTIGNTASAADAANCLVEVVEPAAGIGMVEVFWQEVLNINPQDPIWAGKDQGKCANGIAKNAGKLFDTTMKTLGKVVQGSDKAGGPYTPGTDASNDDKGKIGKAATKLSDAITKACLTLSQDEVNALGSCSRDIGEIAGCITDIARKAASGVNSTSFAMPGTCPSEVAITGEGTFEGGVRTSTALSSGWTGLGHNAEVPEGFRGQVNLNCTDGTCSDCAVTVSCAQGNCRCDGTPGDTCDEPFGPDADDCGGADCIAYFGPPLPLSAGGTPACVVNRIPAELNGTANIGTGQSETTVTNNADVYASGSAVSAGSPCPRCQGDATPNDGIKGGTCELGANAGDPCDVNFTNPILGDTSYDCQPDSSPSTLVLPITLSEQDKSQAFGLDSTVVGPALQVPCNVCQNDGTIACSSDGDCGGDGPCNSSGAGAGTLPNNCGDFNCGADGTCTDGSSTSFCDGYLKQGGGGVIACLTNGDCVALDPECPGGDCGDCTLSEPTACFPDPTVNNNGVGGQNGATLTGQFCTPPTGTGIDNAAGQPGLSNLTIEFDFVGLCDDGITEFELGGNNCP